MRFQQRIVNNILHLIAAVKLQCLLVFGISLVIVLSGFPQRAYTQHPFSPVYYGNVLENQDGIAGNFGEIRANHFHSGIDFKTGEVEGLRVFAAADGYVSRVKISGTGYGKVIYLTHPDNTVTVYGHLRTFYPQIDSVSEKLQYDTRKFEVEFFPKPHEYPVQQGQLIGISGSSGSADGPHLHFETRYESSERPFNPVLKGYQLRDTMPPVIKSLLVYEPGPGFGLRGAERTLLDSTTLYETTHSDTILVGEYTFLGFEAEDKNGFDKNSLGIRAFRLYVDDNLRFSCRIEDFSFDQTRMVNAFIDYPMKVKSGKTIILCFKLPGNELDMYPSHNGIIQLARNGTARCTLVVEDENGNSTTVAVILKRANDLVSDQRIPGIRIRWNYPYSCEGKDFRMHFASRTFYEDTWITWQTESMMNSLTGERVFRVFPDDIPMNRSFEISLRPVVSATRDSSRIVIALIDSTGNLQSIGGSFNRGWISAPCRSFGKFTIAVDSVAPEAQKPFLRPDAYTGNNAVVIPVSDNLSGISQYNCYLNGEWICGEYSPSRKEIVIYPENPLTMGKSVTLELELTDRKMNRSRFHFPVSW